MKYILPLFVLMAFIVIAQASPLLEGLLGSVNVVDVGVPVKVKNTGGLANDAGIGNGAVVANGAGVSNENIAANGGLAANTHGTPNNGYVNN